MPRWIRENNDGEMPLAPRHAEIGPRRKSSLNTRHVFVPHTHN